MFDTIRKNNRAIQIILGLVFLPFAFWGADSLTKVNTSQQTVAKVGSRTISTADFDRALREQQDKLRQAMGGQADAAVLNGPTLRQAVLEGLIHRQLIRNQEADSRFAASDVQVRKLIFEAPIFRENGEFSKKLYESYVNAQGMTPTLFEDKLRQDLTMQQIMSAITDASLPGQTAAMQYAVTQLTTRDVALAEINAAGFKSQVKISDAAIKKWYDDNRKLYELPEQLRVNYLVLDAEALAAQITPTEENLRAYYDSHLSQFTVAEERRASHILITADKDAAKAADETARNKAQALLEQVKKNPAAFAQLARENSQDTGSAANGGDLGWFGRGAMVPVFEKTVFALPENGLSDLVRSDYGYHIIALTGIKPSRAKAFDEVRAEIMAAARKEEASKKFNELSEAFADAVYDQPDSLDSAAAKFKLSVKTSDWMARQGQRLAPPFDNPKLLEAVFADEALKQKHNTKAIATGAGKLVSARVIEHKPAALQALETVEKEIRQQLVEQEAVKLAEKEGLAKLTQLQSGNHLDLAWTPVRSVSRLNTQGLSPQALNAIFKPDAATLPRFAGAASPGGYTLYRIGRETPATSQTSETAKALAERYRQTVAQVEFSSWLSALRTRYPVEIVQKPAEPVER